MSTSKPPEIIHICTCCGKSATTKSNMSQDFYKSYSVYHKKTGCVPLCKDCIKLFTLDGIKLNIDKFKKLLQHIDKPFKKSALEGAINETISDLQKNNEVVHRDDVFNLYGEKILVLFMKNIVMKQYQGLTWDNSDPDQMFSDIEGVEEFINDELVLFWGKGFDINDYTFLQKEIDNWKKTHKCDNQAELTLLKEICIKILELRKARESNQSVGSLQKELQDLMKTASVDPAKANIASAGKSVDAFGLWVKDIEQFKPAEWFENQEKYKDMDGFIPYINNYIKRPIENFLTGVRNFFVDDNIDADLTSEDEKTEGDLNG